MLFTSSLCKAFHCNITLNDFYVPLSSYCLEINGLCCILFPKTAGGNKGSDQYWSLNRKGCVQSNRPLMKSVMARVSGSFPREILSKLVISNLNPLTTNLWSVLLLNIGGVCSLHRALTTHLLSQEYIFFVGGHLFGLQLQTCTKIHIYSPLCHSKLVSSLNSNVLHLRYTWEPKKFSCL